MPSTYVPPHMREAVAGDIGVSFNSVSMNQREYSLREIQNQFGNTPSSVRTLNKSASGALSYILLFGDEHKDWPSQMFCKSNLHLLPEDLAVPGAQHKNDRWDIVEMYLVFEQLADRTRRIAHFTFIGYHFITNIKYFEPHSPELVSKLGAKFRKQDGTASSRRKEAWEESLGMRWAVVELNRVPEEVLKTRGLQNPMVPLKANKGVKEALEELRSRD